MARLLCVVLILMVHAGTVFSCQTTVTVGKDGMTCGPSGPSQPGQPATGFNSPSGSYQFAGVASDVPQCSNLGTEYMGRKGGSAVDAAIVTLLCIGISNPHVAGIGGGFFMTVYAAPRNSTVKEMVTLLARETAPAAATPDMFSNGRASSTVGGMAIAVPGEIKGYYEAWKRFGRLPWRDLFEVPIRVCKDGFNVRQEVYEAVQESMSNPYFTSNPNSVRSLYRRGDGTIPDIGEFVTRPVLAATLEKIAADPESFYTGQLAEDIAADIRDLGGIITTEDLRSYSAQWKAPVTVHLENGNLDLYGPPPPSSAVVTEYILNILDGYGWTSFDVATDQRKLMTYHRILEAFKFGFAKKTGLGDADAVDVSALIQQLTSEEFARSTRSRITDDRTQQTSYYEPLYGRTRENGTTAMAILAADGSAVAVTSDINLKFGCLGVGPRTGIIFNNDMDDFNTPETVTSDGFQISPLNLIAPGKRPQSSQTPMIILNSNRDVVYVGGATGRGEMVTVTALTIARHFWFNMTLKAAVDEPRLHYLLEENIINYDDYFSETLKTGLRTKGHQFAATSGYIMTPTNVQAVSSDCNMCTSGRPCGGCIQAVSDGRLFGAPGGY